MNETLEVFHIPKTNAVVLKQGIGAIIAHEDSVITLLKTGCKIVLRGKL